MGAQKITQTVRIVVIQARTGATIDSSLIVGEGVGFTEQYAQDSLREDLANKFTLIKQFLQQAVRISRYPVEEIASSIVYDEKTP